MSIAVLFARTDSVYKTLPGLDVYDVDRDARTFTGAGPVIAHPPCRAWGTLKHMAKPREGERELAPWAVAVVRKNGGVLEHPKRSALWKDAALAMPRAHMGRDAWGGFTICVPQMWWGHRAEKATYLYIVGIEPTELPPLPFALGIEATAKIGTGGRTKDGKRKKAGDPGFLPEMSANNRERTPADFARWLVALAERIEEKKGQRQADEKKE